jgi:hypothetical protein
MTRPQVLVVHLQLFPRKTSRPLLLNQHTPATFKASEVLRIKTGCTSGTSKNRVYALLGGTFYAHSS